MKKFLAFIILSSLITYAAVALAEAGVPDPEADAPTFDLSTVVLT